MLNNIAAITNSGAAAIVGDYESIETYTLASSQATISFTGIPSTYKHLQLRIMGRTTRTSDTQNSFIYTFNGSSSGYGYTHRLYGNGSVASADAPLGSTYSFGCAMATDGSASNVMGVAIMDILDYANVNKYKTTRILGGNDQNGSGEIHSNSGLWQNSNAINRIDLSVDSFNWAAKTTIALYGIK
jgi:hypothetical protein